MVVLVPTPDPRTWLGAAGYASWMYATLDIPVMLIFLFVARPGIWWYVLPYLVAGWLAGLVLMSLIKTNYHLDPSWRTRLTPIVPAVCAASLGLLRHTAGGMNPDGDINLLSLLPIPATAICLLLTGWIFISIEVRRY